MHKTYYMRFSRLFTAYAALAVIAFAAFPSVDPAQCAVFTQDQGGDKILKEIGVDEKPGGRLPLDAVFTDSTGKKVRLGDYFGGPPVILTLNYYECPMLCPLTFHNLATTFSRMGGLKPGVDYRVVTVSFNPDETTQLAAGKKAETMKMMPNGTPPDAWVFLTGAADDINSLTGATGYRYKKLDKGYAHPAVIMVATPDGRLSRYLYGIEQPPIDMRLALIEASGGKVGPSKTLNRVLLFCYHYDPAGKKYALAATRIMTGLGVVTLVVVGGLLLVMWVREKRRKNA
jgi:protein SCO1